MKAVRFLGILVLALAVVGTACSSAPDKTDPETSPPPPPPPPLKAVAEMQPTEGNETRGTVTFEQVNGKVHVMAKLSGLTPGLHGFHVHENGDCSAPDGTSAGGHFNPTGEHHGGPESSVHHVGDLGNIEADENGNAEHHATLDFLDLGDGEKSILNRGLIVHAKPDDLVSQPTGAAGARLACGVIKKQ